MDTIIENMNVLQATKFNTLAFIEYLMTLSQRLVGDIVVSCTGSVCDSRTLRLEDGIWELESETMHRLPFMPKDFQDDDIWEIRCMFLNTKEG